MKKNIKKTSFSGVELETKKVSSGRHSCTRTGGRVQSFSFMCLSGNKNPIKPMIGYKNGKSKTNSGAKTKAIKGAVESASTIYFPYNEKTKTIKFSMSGKCGATEVLLRPGSGLSVPDFARVFFELIGLLNVSMKIIGPTNKRNVFDAIKDAFSRSELYK